MDTIIVLQIINMVLSAFAPIIAALPTFLSRITKSECCGAKITTKKVKEDEDLEDV